MQVINDTDLHHFGKEMNKHMNSHKSSFCKKKKMFPWSYKEYPSGSVPRIFTSF